MAAEAARVALRCNDAWSTGQLDLSACQLTSLPLGVFTLVREVKVTSVDLSDNIMSKLTPKIAQLAHVQVLSLARNKLTSLPDEMGALSELRSLNLAGNKLTQLPDVISTLTGLESLDLSGNDIVSIDVPTVLGPLKSLNVLNINGNCLDANTISSLWQLRCNTTIDDNRTPPQPGDLPITHTTTRHTQLSYK
ncbi:hypothetical protein CAOG_09024 [Capsaspora owczarzaki ATCC 30864]|uniref:Uncharacterized protein n=1 Tax=Capsaspora owczarzaki (strain ATCC 30864) TaxID=595528 RepID=A0A0D2WW55_CAPO3|nr:hypothetical protein CAOG_09024 [Capsaspora owczarzaki ATCC 30864]KJE96658.1 hypothetical protein CAOG_009024 [Capsaspora owczarzaki ATCC 30864]|eukprot:XP_011270712.1 hypothetical protein CAOG_09024 [Capsaspora owczarzaki ATCC 30864]